MMGDSVAWPALSESARAPVKSLSVESTPRAIPNGSDSSSQVRLGSSRSFCDYSVYDMQKKLAGS